MPKSYSRDLRERVVGFVGLGNSCHAASRHFLTSPSFVINLMKLVRETGSVEPRRRGSPRPGKLAPHRDFLLRRVEETPDVTMPELATELLGRGVAVRPSSISRFLLSCGLSYKKNRSGDRNAPSGRARGPHAMGGQASAVHGS
jgi:transposase